MSNQDRVISAGNGGDDEVFQDFSLFRNDQSRVDLDAGDQAFSVHGHQDHSDDGLEETRGRGQRSGRTSSRLSKFSRTA